MAKRRFQAPTPELRGAWWTLRVWKDVFAEGKHKRVRERIRLAPASKGIREVQKIAEQYLSPMNQGLETIGSATNFKQYVENTYMQTKFKKLASSTQDRSKGVIEKYLLPAFGKFCLRDISPMALDKYFTDLGDTELMHESVDKIRDVLASIVTSAQRHGLLVKNPLDGLELPRMKRTKRTKQYLSPEQFELLLEQIAEPYATMVYVAIYTGLRVSELAGLKWNDLHEDSITIDERYCRGDWDVPKSESSNATIGVNRCVIERIHRMKLLTVHVKAGLATRKYKVVKADGPEDLVFQSVRTGVPMRDNNILSRHIKPAARKLGLEFVNWRCLRTSHATWLKMAGADVKDAQAQMRHSRASTTLDIYQQFVPESQKRVVDKLNSLSKMVN